MNPMILAAALLLLFTKLLDVLSTLLRLTDPSQETNPLANNLMTRLGPRAVVWLIFVLAALIIAVSAGIALRSAWWMQMIYIVFSIFVSTIQTAVAYSNLKGRDNFITRVVRRVYLRSRKYL